MVNWLKQLLINIIFHLCFEGPNNLYFWQISLQKFDRPLNSIKINAFPVHKRPGDRFWYQNFGSFWLARNKNANPRGQLKITCRCFVIKAHNCKAILTYFQLLLPRKLFGKLSEVRAILKKTRCRHSSFFFFLYFYFHQTRSTLDVIYSFFFFVFQYLRWDSWLYCRTICLKFVAYFWTFYSFKCVFIVVCKIN